ncbi:hypothetical protein [Arthrobacter crystallopoietes]|uniref:Uncharacterized protein n=1 Tax=Crystallibacter crystallopoietes TaxID=37928 RepID=A0A1H1CX57_9MICC|nr:hypothetical protein [Arthrobacter crystallopoietes]SDQ68156.1 hypothetical protein SAMN04489742_2111 [Arthrobacter crystallopoietes]
MGPDYRRSAADVDYRQDSRTHSTAEDQLEAFNIHSAGLSGPIDVAWNDREDVP